MQTSECTTLQIDRTWQLRLNPSTLEECRRQVATLKIKLRFPTFQFELASVSEVSDYLRACQKSESLQNRLQLLLLHASLLRAYGKAEQGQKWMRNLYDSILQLDCAFPFRFFFERGLFFLYFNDCFSAMQDFLAASACNSNPVENIMAEINLLISQEHLGLSTENCESKISLLLKKTEVESFPPGVLNQWEAFLLRKEFRKGNISCVLQSASQSRLTQKSCFSIWAQSLPFHRHYQGIIDFQSLFEEDTFFYLKSFRYRTLQNHLHPDDFKISKVSELVDRVYLWTWRWLIAPESQGLERLLLLIEKTNLLSQVNCLSCGDIQMLENSLLWLSLFDQSSQYSFLKKIEQLETRGPIQEEYPIFSLENWTLHYLIARRDGAEVQAQDYLKMLKTHPLWNSHDLFFRKLVEVETGLEVTHLNSLIKNLNGIIHPEAQNIIKTEWQIESQKFLIQNLKTGESIHSEAISKSMELLKNTSSVSAEEFCRVVFGLYQYDSLVHNSKIYNLLARMKSYFHSLRFSFKGGRIFAEGDWSQISLLSGGARTHCLQQSLRWKTLAEAELAPATDTKKLDEPSGERVILSRPELDRLLGQSRSGTHRVLMQLKRKGLLQVEGRARNTRYQVSALLFKKMKEGSV